MRPVLILIPAAVCLVTGAFAQEKSAGREVDLAAITERGRAIYAYDQAAWHGTDAIFELKPEMKGMAHYICSKSASGWVVVFPKWNAAHDQLTVVYEARETDGKYAARKLDAPAAADNDTVAKERALELAIAEFPAPSRP